MRDVMGIAGPPARGGGTVAAVNGRSRPERPHVLLRAAIDRENGVGTLAHQ
jgi:hypothetical protein